MCRGDQGTSDVGGVSSYGVCFVDTTISKFYVSLLDLYLWNKFYVELSLYLST